MIVALLAAGLAIWVALVVLSVVLVRRAGASAGRLPPEQAIALAELSAQERRSRVSSSNGSSSRRSDPRAGHAILTGAALAHDHDRLPAA